MQIARDWNVPESGSGFVTQFRVRNEFMRQFDVQTVGSRIHTEWWIPAGRVEEMNDNIVGLIEVIREFRATDS